MSGARLGRHHDSSGKCNQRRHRKFRHGTVLGLRSGNEPWGFIGQSATRICYFWHDAGIKQVYICPDLNYGAAIHADKWIPVLPNTDAALQLAIIHTWITEGTYDKEYVKTHTVGFDKVADYVLGKEDGIAKTPEWASAKCGVPEWTIKALARKSAAKRTSIGHVVGGSLIRGPYSHEPARLEAILLGMQGLGKPGIHQVSMLTEVRDTIPKSLRTALSSFTPTKPGDRIRGRTLQPILGLLINSFPRP